jgi:hypothetical protein
VHTVVDAIAPSGRFVFTAQSGAARTEMGGRLLLDGPLELKVDADMPAGARVVMFRNGEALRTGGKTAVHRSDRRRGVYRVEIQVPGAPGLPSVPWVLSNPIHVDEVPHALTEAEPQPERGPAPLRLGAATVEHDPSSSIELTRESVDKVQMVRLTYELGGGPRQSQYVALVVPRNGIPARFNRLAFTGSASRPMRMSLQVRNEAGERWQRSVYLDSLPRTVRLEFDELTRIEHPNQAGRPPLDQVRAILAVVDTVNTTPGSSGTVTIEGLRFSR